MEIPLYFNIYSEGLFTGPESSVPIDYAKVSTKEILSVIVTNVRHI
ncbi:hypothetical protein TcasGA2_TC034346 [Tribolium castaneum]|uniref:Uncharacterized protein n=1 Tax=Tribolium castaneum TaxID=7070 RepID=A0A139WBC0_TRICA|nr:hypothetical protein TcasGA2_TC034346 [Tribolium castaneum]